MPNRREFLLATAGLAAATSLRSLAASRPEPLGALAFDGFPLIDARPALNAVKALLNGAPDNAVETWRARTFDYTWLRALGGQYQAFLPCAEDALKTTARQFRIELPADAGAGLRAAFMGLSVWPDVPAALERLRQSGLRLAFLSNLSPEILSAVLRNSALRPLFDTDGISTDMARTYKPAPQAYALGPQHFDLPRERILFVASSGWDAAGARWFGYPTYWVNRSAAPEDELGLHADGQGADMAALLGFIAARG
jgi:2-haloacid dehalogenase